MALQTTGALKDTFVVFYAWVDMLPTITPKGNVCVCYFFRCSVWYCMYISRVVPTAQAQELERLFEWADLRWRSL